MSSSKGRQLLAAAWACLLCGPLLAGTVEIAVRDEDGGRLPGVKLSMRLSGGGSGVFNVHRSRYGETDRSGQVVFEDVPTGQYEIKVRGAARSLYVDPENNPFVKAPLLTLERDDQTVRAEVELWRGVEVVCRVIYGGRLTPSVTAHFREVDHGQRFELRLPEGAERELRIVPGRWEVVLDPPLGHLLTDVEVNGRSTDGHAAMIELQSPSPPNYVTWYFAAPAELTGRVSFENEEVGVTVVARLLEAGPWLEAALRRGGSAYEIVEAGLDPLRQYEMTLPDGRWEVRATGKWVAGADPDVVELVLQPGDTRRQDFHVRDDRGEGSGLLLVEVRDPDGRPVDGATVEVWPLDPDMRGEEPLAREKVRWRSAFIRGISAGSYVVAAAARGYIEGHVELRGFDPKEEDRDRVRVVLGRGATVHAVATDEEDRRVAGVQLTLEREDEEPPRPAPIVRDPELRDLAFRRDGETDATGHAWIRGVWPGTYRLQGRMDGPDGAGRFVRFPDDRRRVADSVELVLSDGEEREVDARVLPAAKISGQVACRDGNPVPGLVTITVLPASVDPASLDDVGPLPRALLTLTDVPLTGKLRDTFSAGPLDHGAYLVAIQPAGHDRWTWIPGTERAEEATPIQALPGDPEVVGMVQIDCGPVIRLRPVVRSGEALPDLREKLPALAIAEARGTVVNDDDGERRVRRVLVDPYRDRVLLRELPEGAAKLEVILRNGYFVPGPAVTFSIEATLERGRTVDVYPSVGSIGGMLRLRHGEGVTAHLLDADEAKRTTAVEGGRADFVSLEPGPYRMDLCSDPECRDVISSWTDLEVEPLETLEVTPTSP